MRIWFVLCLALASLSIPTYGEPPPQDPDEAAEAPAEQAEERPGEEQELETPFDVLRNERLTGDWWGARRWLEDHGVTIDLGLTTIYQHNAKGGLRTYNAHRVSGSYDLELTLDTAAMGLFKGGTVYAYATGGWDWGVSPYVGDLLGVNDDIEGQQEIYLPELWYEHSFLENRLRVRLGKLDLSVDFDTSQFANDSTAQFLNSGLVNTGNVPLPDPGHGVQFVATPWDWLYFAAGVVDAEANVLETGFRTAYHGPRDLFSIYEFGLTPAFDTPWGQLPGNYRFGMWYDPQPKEKFFNSRDDRIRHAPLKRDDTGFYLSFDQAVWRENPATEEDEQGVGWFFRYGYAHGDVNTIEHFWSTGAQYLGLIPTRDEDVLGFGVAQGILSEDLRLTKADPHRETALELYYNIKLLPWLTLSPDFQWILRPGGEHGRDAFVAACASRRHSEPRRVSADPSREREQANRTPRSRASRSPHSLTACSANTGVHTMQRSWRWKCLVATLSTIPLLGATCATAVRDAIESGALDFVTGTVTEVLTRTVPVADTVVPVAEE